MFMLHMFVLNYWCLCYIYGYVTTDVYVIYVYVTTDVHVTYMCT